MAAFVTASPVEVRSTAPLAAPTSFVTAPSIVRRVDAVMTTPYVFPPECTLVFNMTSCSTDIADGFGKVEETFRYVELYKNDHWGSCQPTGWVTGIAPGTFIQQAAPTVYRGAVCPSDWMAFNVGLASYTKTYGETQGPQTWSSAVCCRNGDTLGPNVWGLNVDSHYKDDQASVCVSVTQAPQSGYDNGKGTTTYESYVVYGETTYLESISTYTHTETWSGRVTTHVGTYTPLDYIQMTLPFTAGRAFYPAMSMEWFEEDNLTLNPTWPTLTSDMLIPTWTPGAVPDNYFGQFDNKGKGRTVEVKPEPSMPNKVAIPVIAVLAALLLISLGFILFQLWKGRREQNQELKNRRASSRQLGLAMSDEAGSTAHLARESGSENPALRKRGGIVEWLKLKNGSRGRIGKKDIELTEVPMT